MLKTLKRTVCGLLVVGVLFSCSSCTLYESTYAEELGVTFGYSNVKGDCFVGEIEHSKNSPTEIVLPETFNGLPVVQLGGYVGTGVPSPFGAYCAPDYFPDEYVNPFTCEDEYVKTLLDERVILEVDNILFKITLPRRLKRIKNTALKLVTGAERTDGGSKRIKIFRPVYYFEIDEENPYFYTDDGKLYDKKTNELFFDCIYEAYEYIDE